MTNFSISKKKFSQPSSFSHRIKFLIIHYTELNLEESLHILQGNNPKHNVSAHYLISDGVSKTYPSHIYQLVDEKNCAFHAGISHWEDFSHLNNCSIGIEIVNLDGNKHTYTDQQINAVIYLVKNLIEKYKITPKHILGHSDIAPDRKIDPGKLFPWKKLFDEGIGAWPDEDDVNAFRQQELPDIKTIQQSLKKYGFPIDLTGKIDKQTELVVGAFQSHFRQKKVDGIIDTETWAILASLNKKYHC